MKKRKDTSKFEIDFKLLVNFSKRAIVILKSFTTQMCAYIHVLTLGLIMKELWIYLNYQGVRRPGLFVKLKKILRE